MKIKVIVASVFLSFFTLSNAIAFELGAGLRSMGPVVELGKKFGNNFNIRAAIGNDYASGESEYSSSEELKVSSILSGSMGQWDLSHASLLVDYHPWQGNFRITFGAMDSTLRWFVENRDVESFSFNDQNFSNTVVSSTELDVQFTDGISPYLGIGWATGYDKEKGFSFNGDFGLVGISDFMIRFDANCVAGQILSDACVEVKQNAKKELEQLQLDEILSFLPLAGMGISYKF